ncbi:MAG: hypothetical protein JWM21_4350 [Acidobacteria bacterium]|nr:hypothetical protein [Acidobacteriota bacterium]
MKIRRKTMALISGIDIKTLFSHSGFCLLAVIVVGGFVVWQGAVSRRALPLSTTASHAGENDLDEALQRAATEALGRQEGTIIVVDPQTGRVRAVVNQQLAFENSYSPGSTIKPFTALAALRAGLIDKSSTTLCREHYTRKDFHTVCAHPRDLPPLNPAEAIAWSCNYYFGTLGERLNEALLSETLSSFGFGRPAMTDGLHNHAGQLLRGKNDPRNALGEGDHLQTTPIQLVMAYSALVNGGHLLTPRVAASADFQVVERARLHIAPEHRAIIVEGMRGAVLYGTAARAGLNSSSLKLFGKTGTSTPLKGFRSQGWFVGFAAAPDNQSQLTPADIHLAVLVFLKRAHGANAAALSRRIFAEYERAEKDDADSDESQDAETRGRGDTGTSDDSSISKGTDLVTQEIPVSPLLPLSVSVPSASDTVRVHLVTENVTREMPLEDYVLGVVGAEGSMEDQPEALKTLAVAARTYAVKNAGRHAREGFDFCTTTHCQRFIAAADRAQPRAVVVDAVRQTTGEILRDGSGQLVDSYFSASCGGVTANLQTLWGAKAPTYLRGVTDEFCASMPHHSWTDVVPSERLLLALRSDPRTDPGAHLKDVMVARRDATGRAELIIIDGERRHTVNGWDFKIIVGRKLGWNLLKSSRFEVARSGTNYVFRGSGFGHGLGLCQEGAHVMAQRGVNYRQILAKYFPGTSVSQIGPNRVAVVSREQKDFTDLKALGDQKYLFAALPPHSAVRLCLTDQVPSYFSEAAPRFRASASKIESPFPERHSGKAAIAGDGRAGFAADLIWNSISTIKNVPSAGSLKRTSISSEHFRVSYPVTTPQRAAEGILKTLETTRANLLQKISRAGITMGPLPAFEIFINATTGDFVGRTGQPWWAAAATKGNLIELQPAAVLRKRGVLDTSLRHELVHTFVDRLSQGRAPRWLAEGMALYFAGEGRLVARYASTQKSTVKEIEERLTKASTAEEMRSAYAAAYGEVAGLVKSSGEASLWRRLAGASTP